MSAYMVENENLCKMARYISDILTAQDTMGTVTGVKKIWVNKPTMNLFKGFKGFYDAAHGEFRAEALHKALYEMNRDAIIACYGKCAECFEPFDGKNVDEREETRDEWQCRLFTVVRNYLYQCSEGDVPETLQIGLRQKRQPATGDAAGAIGSPKRRASVRARWRTWCSAHYECPTSPPLLPLLGR